MRVAVIVILLVCSSLAEAQYHSFIPLSIEDGLAQSQVNHIHQSKDGYLWLATASGLSRYDGTSISNYYKSDGLVDNGVTYILEGDDGRLYFGGVGGVTILDEQGFHPYRFPKSLIDSRVQYLDMSNDSTLWLATNRDGYFSFSLSTLTYGVPLLEQRKNIRWLDIASGGVAGREGVFVRGKVLHPALAGVNVSDVIVLRDTLWVSTLGDGLFVYSNSDCERIDEAKLPMGSFIRDMELTPAGILWAVGPEGAMSYEKGKWCSHSNLGGLDYLNMRHVSLDREGNVWLSSNGQGAFRYTGDLFTTYKTGAPLLSDLMLSACQRDGRLYMGMFDNGMQVIERDGSVSKVNEMLDTDVWCMVQDAAGCVWAGTSSGLYCSMPGRPFMRRYADGLPNQRITSLYIDDMDNLWIGHREGVTVAYSDTELKDYTVSEGFEGKRIRSICQASDGAMWLGAQNGLFRLEDDWILQFTEEHGLNDNTIYTIDSDRFGRLWVGAKSGLHILQQDSIIQVILGGRIDANNVNFLHSSSDGYLYVGTNQGLFAGEVKEEVSTMRFRRYAKSEGLPGLECNLNAVYEQADGQVWFGTNTGVVRFASAELSRDTLVTRPDLRIMDVRLFAEPIDYKRYMKGQGGGRKLTFEHDENHLSFAFKGIRMRDPEGVRYEYRLEGVDQDWLPANVGPSVTYSALPFGDFVFNVRTLGVDGQVTSQATLPFIIRSPLYLRWWALLSAAIAIGLLIALVMTARKRQRSRKEEVVALGYRTRMQDLEQASLNASMNRHVIFNSLNAIQFYINRQDKRSANRYLSSFAKLIRKNLDSTTQPWVTLSDELERLELYLSLEQMRFEDKFSLKISISKSISADEVNVPAMMLQPYVENAIWHGILPQESGGEVRIDIERVGNRIRIRIDDDGIGIDESMQNKQGQLVDHESKGMEITHHRLRLYGEMTGNAYEVQGPYQLEEKGVILGTRIDVYIPIAKKSP